MNYLIRPRAFCVRFSKFAKSVFFCAVGIRRVGALGDDIVYLSSEVSVKSLHCLFGLQAFQHEVPAAEHGGQYHWKRESLLFLASLEAYREVVGFSFDFYAYIILHLVVF